MVTDIIQFSCEFPGVVSKLDSCPRLDSLEEVADDKFGNFIPFWTEILSCHLMISIIYCLPPALV